MQRASPSLMEVKNGLKSGVEKIRLVVNQIIPEGDL